MTSSKDMSAAILLEILGTGTSKAIIALDLITCCVLFPPLHMIGLVFVISVDST